MATATKKLAQEKFSFTSSIKADVWHQKSGAEAFEWWYFDALSDDGRDAVVIIFLDNFIFSPRYNHHNRNSNKDWKVHNRAINKIAEWSFGIKSRDDDDISISPDESKHQKFPALAFIYYRDGKPVYRAINEFPADSFTASKQTPSCIIGDNSFRFESAPYGSGYVLSINALLSKNRKLEAHFEWLSVESDFLPNKPVNLEDSHSWNLAVARADVTGQINVSSEDGMALDVVNFRGTGYHDHNIDNRWLPETVSDWQWGRAHFNDATAVFYRYKETGEAAATTKFFTIRKGNLRDGNAIYEERNFKRDKFGIKYPTKMTFTSENDVQLKVKQNDLIDSSFFYLRFLSEMTLILPDEQPRKIVGITEYLQPKILKYRWLDWLVNMRIGRKGKGSFLP